MADKTPGIDPTTAPPDAQPGDPFIEFKDVYKSFGRNVIYEGLDLTIRRGETITVIGGSGTGKSVMLKMLIGLLSCDRGEILVDGFNVVGRREIELLPIRRRIAMLFQGSALFDSLTVAENIAYPLVEQTTMSQAERADRVAQVLEWVGLPGIEGVMPSELSGGMRKRIGLARAIAVGPECILYDEPTTGLDPGNTRRISELILSMHERIGCTSIVVTHDMPSAFMISDRIAMVAERRIAIVDTAENVRNSAIPQVREFIHAMEGDHAEAMQRVHEQAAHTERSPL
jgi:phospholipid/cholesterol/gamma-HCH transport system ATP-binding protein